MGQSFLLDGGAADEELVPDELGSGSRADSFGLDVDLDEGGSVWRQDGH